MACRLRRYVRMLAAADFQRYPAIARTTPEDRAYPLRARTIASITTATTGHRDATEERKRLVGNPRERPHLRV